MKCFFLFLIFITLARGVKINVAYHMEKVTSSRVLYGDEKNYGPRNAVDGDITTEFTTEGTGYIQLDLKKTYKIDFIIVKSEDNVNIIVNVGNNYPKETCQEVRMNLLNLINVIVREKVIRKYFCVKKEARYVKVESKWNSLIIKELEVYADVHSKHINIALNKESKVVKNGKESSAPECVDGLMEVCVKEKVDIVLVDLGETRNINYIHLYSSGDSEPHIEVLKNENSQDGVRCYKRKQENDKKKYICGENESQTILIPYTTSLKEVEAFSQITDWRNEYVGCYKGTGNMTRIAGDVEDVETCLILCRNNEQPLALIQQNKCYCDSTLPSTSENSNVCSSKCTTDHNPCGSSQHFSVYLTKYLKYLGCFKDSNYDRVIYGSRSFQSSSQNSIERCWTACSVLGQQYFGLEYAKECHCGNFSNIHGVSNGCDYKCPGNERQTCGGSGAIEIYEACPIFARYLNACSTHAPHCKSINSEGKCEYRCQLGWEGSQCSQRNCSVNNGDCGSHSCKEFSFGKDKISECVCKEGFFKTNYNGFCEDRDECQQKPNPCNEQSSICNNTQGSYECVCKSVGFRKVDSKTCIDINECEEGLHNCTKNEACVNGMGSFSCDCLPGYVRNKTLCEDVNECLGSVCNAQTHVCFNLPGSYSCQLEKTISIGMIAGLISLFALIIIILIAAFFSRRKVKSFVQRKSMRIASSKSHYNTVDLKDTEKLKDNQNIMEDTRIPIKNILNYYLNQEKLISDQFTKCPKTTDSSKEIGSNSKVSVKNRFKSIYPYDFNRVILDGSDDPVTNYINASFISAYETKKDYSFIATQGPKEKTIEDFWKMLVQYSVPVVVMLTRCFEEGMSKCNQYWPTNASEAYGSLRVSVMVTTIQSNVEIRVLSVKDQNGNVHVVRHILYKSWPDKSVPINAMDLINLRSIMLDLLKEAKVSKHTPHDKLCDIKPQYVVVHCSAGVGRTGTFICLDNLIYEADHKKSVDVLQAMTMLRKERCFMVQTKDQYKLCYKCICLYQELGYKTIVTLESKEQLKKQIKELNKKTAQSSMMQKQFDMIQSEIAGQEIKDNNKANIELSSGKIEVSYVPSAKKPSKYMMGVITKSLSANDLVEVIKNHASVIVLIEPQKNLQSFLEDLKGYSSSEKISLFNESKEPQWHIAKFYDGNLEDLRDNNIYSNIDVSEENMPGLKKVVEICSVNHDNASYVSDIIKQESDEDPIMILSSNNYNEASVLVAALQIAETIECSKTFDVHQSAYCLKYIERSCYNTFDLFKRVYDIAEKLSEKHFETSKNDSDLYSNGEIRRSKNIGIPDEDLYQNYQECDTNLYENAYQ